MSPSAAGRQEEGAAPGSAIAALEAPAPVEALQEAPGSGEDPLSAEDALDHDKVMPLSGHLEELRRRLIFCLAFWVGASCLAYSFNDEILIRIRQVAGNNFTFIYTSPTEAFMAWLKLAMVLGLFVSLPVLIYHGVAFIAPGLTNRERRWLFRLVPFSIILFALGAAFAWWVALPVTWRFFLSFQNEGVQAMWTIGEAVGFVVGLVTLTGLVFEMPLVLLFASALGLVRAEVLARYRRIIYFGAFVAAAVITPTPDAFTACLVALPLLVLFEISMIFMRLISPRRGEVNRD